MGVAREVVRSQLEVYNMLVIPTNEYLYTTYISVIKPESCYLVTGNRVGHFGSRTKPKDSLR